MATVAPWARGPEGSLVAICKRAVFEQSQLLSMSLHRTASAADPPVTTTLCWPLTVGARRG
eukprot:10457216-Alexandrium_andersonii.AAC.1